MRNALLLLLALAAAGCISEDVHRDTICFAWHGAACPAKDDAALYLGLDGAGNCTRSLVSIDGAAANKDGECCYPVTVDDEGCPPSEIL